MVMPDREMLPDPRRGRLRRWREAVPDVVPMVVNGRLMLVPRYMLRAFQRSM
jgi:large subunit ribosomal protein L32